MESLGRFGELPTYGFGRPAGAWDPPEDRIDSTEAGSMDRRLR